jgi:hypothetical protein
MNKEIKKIVELGIDLDNLELEDMGVDIVSFVKEPAIEVDFLAFNKENTSFVDNRGFEHFKEWIYTNKDLFKKPGGGAAGQGGVNHREQLELLEQKGINVEFPFGYCFQVAQFLFYAVGGYESDYDLKCISKMQYQIDGVEFESTHWYIQNRETGKIVDLTAQQFDGILDINQYYSEGRRSNLGFPYYNVGNKKVEFENTVPSIQTLKLYDKYREDVEKLEGIEKYWKAAKYAELRREFEMQFTAEYFVEPRVGESESDFMSRCIPVVIDEGYGEQQAAAICYSYYEGQEFDEVLNIFGYIPSHFEICPAAISLFRHLVEDMDADEETQGMIRSAALQADKVFEIEKRVLELQEATDRDLRQAMLLANDFVDLMNEIDEELQMSHDVSWMAGHIETIASYYKGEAFDDLEDACWTGYEPIGLKPGRGGRMVPNCVPIENEKFESYTDYPESAKRAAKRALEWKDTHPDNTCGTRVGWARANQLAKGEPISERTIARMASFKRHQQHKDVPYSEGCGGLMWDAWGGTAGIEWAENKLDEIRGEMDADTSGLKPYIDQRGIEDPRKKSFSEDHVITKEEEKIILEWAEEYGETITEDYTFIDPAEKFESVTDIAKAVQGLDILGKLGVRQDEPAEIKYRYEGPNPERGFCKALIRLNKVYSDSDMQALESRLSTINPGMGPRGRNSYNVFSYKGGVNCRHYWSKVALFKPEGKREVLMIEQGPANGDAGKSNNRNTPSPGGSVRNNASLQNRFSFNIQNEEQRLVAGPLMIPNQFIMRRDENDEPYYVYFSKDTIRNIQLRFSEQNNYNKTDVAHNGEVIDDNIMVEQWIIQSRQYDKSRYYGFDNLPLGTWFGVYKINNDETWQKIKSGELKGFSVAGDFIDKAQPVREESNDTLEQVKNILKEIND